MVSLVLLLLVELEALYDERARGEQDEGCGRDEYDSAFKS